MKNISLVPLPLLVLLYSIVCQAEISTLRSLEFKDPAQNRKFLLKELRPGFWEAHVLDKGKKAVYTSKTHKHLEFSELFRDLQLSLNSWKKPKECETVSKSVVVVNDLIQSKRKFCKASNIEKARITALWSKIKYLQKPIVHE